MIKKKKIKIQSCVNENVRYLVKLALWKLIMFEE